MPALLYLSDSTNVMAEGHLTGTLSRAEANAERIMHLAAPSGKAAA